MVDGHMHEEAISVNASNIEELLTENIRIAVGNIILLERLKVCIGFGVKLHTGDPNPLQIEKLYPYQLNFDN